MQEVDLDMATEYLYSMAANGGLKPPTAKQEDMYIELVNKHILIDDLLPSVARLKAFRESML